MNKKLQEKTLSLLLSGKHPKAKKFAGHHVLVINDKVFPFKAGQEGVDDIEMLEKRYGVTPTITFIPRHDVSYILICKK